MGFKKVAEVPWHRVEIGSYDDSILPRGESQNVGIRKARSAMSFCIFLPSLKRPRMGPLEKVPLDKAHRFGYSMVDESIRRPARGQTAAGCD